MLKYIRYMTIALSFGLFLIVNGYSAETMPKPYLVLKIDGKTYKPNETVLVRKGEKITKNGRETKPGERD